MAGYKAIGCSTPLCSAATGPELASRPLERFRTPCVGVRVFVLKKNKKRKINGNFFLFMNPAVNALTAV